jgi:hypothetical protein
MPSLPLLAILIQALGGSAVDALESPAGAKAVVYLFTSVDCPVSNRYAPEMRRLIDRFSPQGVVFRLVYPGRPETDEAIRKHMMSFGYSGALAYRDPDMSLVRHVGATITPEVAVLVRGKVVYRGRIDDRYADLGVERPAATSHDLADALTASLAGKAVPHPTTQAVGCFISDLAR